VLGSDVEVGRHLTTEALDKLFDPANYRGEAGAFVDRVLDSYELSRHVHNKETKA
jgi:adenylosuccinate lyase